MKNKVAAFLLAVLFVLSGFAAAYSRCVDVNLLDSATEDDTPFIHCPDDALNSTTQMSSSGRSYRGEPGKILPSSTGCTGRALTVAHYNQSKFIKPFSQQDLYRLEEVFRL